MRAACLLSSVLFLTGCNQLTNWTDGVVPSTNGHTVLRPPHTAESTRQVTLRREGDKFVPVDGGMGFPAELFEGTAFLSADGQSLTLTEETFRDRKGAKSVRYPEMERLLYERVAEARRNRELTEASASSRPGATSNAIESAGTP